MRAEPHVDPQIAANPMLAAAMPVAQAQPLAERLIRNVNDLLRGDARDDELAANESVLRLVLSGAHRVEVLPETFCPVSGYTRNILYADPRGRFTVLQLVWAPGACTPLHGHHVWCTFGVLRGSLDELRAADDQPARHAPGGAFDPMPAGEVRCDLPGDGVHQIRNATNAMSVSIHIYGVDVNRIGTHVNRLIEPMMPA
jgi:predicted metal-dependent enzyme (double-stranded beta helix superfamily)